MKKVITYGTYDLLHYGHIRLLERAKALGDYLIVGVTADDFDKTRGKINVQQSLMERIEAVRATGIADEIIVEEYEGQKIDDIRRLGVDIFTVGSDWVGKFDYLKKYCEVVYLPRTEGVSSSEIRAEKRKLKIGVVGENRIVPKFVKECGYVNGIKVVGYYSLSSMNNYTEMQGLTKYKSYEELLEESDAIYLVSNPLKHYEQIKCALSHGKHILCESPIATSNEECKELFSLARTKNCILFDGIKTAYSTAYSRLLLLVKSGKIGDVISIDATCTSLQDINVADSDRLSMSWNSLCAWGPTVLLPVYQILGVSEMDRKIVSKLACSEPMFDYFTKIDLIFGGSVATVKVGNGVKSEGELIISGTKGYIYVPAPWWKTDYFEIRYENPADNKRYFYQLDGEGIRYEIVAFAKAIRSGVNYSYVDQEVSKAIVDVIDDFEHGRLTII